MILLKTMLQAALLLALCEFVSVQLSKAKSHIARSSSTCLFLSTHDLPAAGNEAIRKRSGCSSTFNMMGLPGLHVCLSLGLFHLFYASVVAQQLGKNTLQYMY